MTSNINPATGIPYGIIKADAIDSDVLQDLLYRVGTDISYKSALEEHLATERRKHENEMEEKRIAKAELDGGTLDEDLDFGFDEDVETENFSNAYQCDESIIEGEHEGVQYRTTWLGGAQMLYVFKSPVLTKCRPCSPCVPNAGDLDSVGDYLAYGVPVGWLDETFIMEQCDAAGFEFTEGPDDVYWREVGNDAKHGGPFKEQSAAFEDCYRTNLQTDAPCEDEGCPHHGTDHICNPTAGGAS